MYDFISEHDDFDFFCNNERELVNLLDITLSKAMTKDLTLRSWWFEGVL